jgi:predicted Zn-dependent peptidase
MKCGKLKNGWKYILHPNACLKTVTILILFATGSIDEMPEERGLSHFIEHMFFKGTTNHKAAKDITQTIYKLGGYINAYTSYNYTGYYIQISKEYLHNALQVLSDILFKSTFRSEAIEREKFIVIQENKKHASEPNRVLNDLTNSLVYRGTSLENEIGGYDKDIKWFTRKMILNYLAKNYGDVVVSVVGGVVGPNVLNKYFGKPWYATTTAKVYPSIKTVNQKEPAFKMLKHSFTEVYLSVTFPIEDMFADEKTHLMADIISVVLGGNMNSRLFMKLREKKQYVYSVRCDPNHYQVGGDISIRCGTQKKYIKKVVAGILDEVKHFKITAQELKEAVNYTVGQLVLNAEDSTEVVFYQAYQYLYMDKCRKIEDEIALYKKLKLTEVNEYARQIFDMKKLNIAILM